MFVDNLKKSATTRACIFASFFENCRLVKSILFLKALRQNMFCESFTVLYFEEASFMVSEVSFILHCIMEKVLVEQQLE